MANTLLDRAQMTVTGTPGTGNVTLNAATTGYQSFSAAGARDNQFISYLIVDGNNWEFGQGTYQSSGPTLVRTRIYNSTSSGSAINASSASIVSIVPTAEDIQPVVQRPLNWNGAAFMP